MGLEENTILRMAALVLFCLLFFLMYIVASYAFPLTAYFENTVAGTLRNAIGMGLGNLRQTIFAIAITMLPLVIALVSLKLFVTLLFLMVMMGPGAISYGVVCVLQPVFLRYIPEEEKEGLI